MIERLRKAINYNNRLQQSLNLKIINKYTQHFSSPQIKELSWDTIQHLHILNNSWDSNFPDGFPNSGFFIDGDNQWLLILNANVEEIENYVSSCTANLKLLDIRFTDIEKLDIRHLKGLKELHLPYNSSLAQVYGVSLLDQLEILRVRNTNLGIELDINNCSELNYIDISHTHFRRVILDHSLEKLHIFNGSNTFIENAFFVNYFPEIRKLELSNTAITDLPSFACNPKLETLHLKGNRIVNLPSLEYNRKLRVLTLNHTHISSLDNVAFPLNLESLVLSGTQIQRLPEGIRKLKKLNYLSLKKTKLDELPYWLPELGLPISSKHVNRGVVLCGASIKGMDMSIFTQSQEMILQWFSFQRNVQALPLNELKIVFLGDGEVGKSLTIARLLQNGNYPDDFDGNSTPGINIQHREYQLDGKFVKIHFWDFGGQEILHSMHRMFLTTRTLYVVLINARDDTQDDRAQYWLHNIKSFADGAPVLLVLNKIDQNRNASINERDLHAMYPELKKVIRMSALTDSPDDFNSNFTNALLEQVSKFETLASPFLPSWTRLKNKLETMSDNYIRGDVYNRLSQECGVEGGENLHKDLLKWFNDLGISFCYSGSTRLEDYVILRPDWITNAIYTIIFNKEENTTNGILSINEIFRLLHPLSGEQNGIRRVNPDSVYNIDEIEYILNVIRKFRLSYLVRENEEFIPMLCQRNSSPIAEEYADDPKTLEFRMVYDYLPNNVIHRLMVDLRLDLDTNHVWRTGALFIQRGTGLSSVVKIEGNVLRILIRSNNPLHKANTYLSIIREAINRINEALNLQISEQQVVYKHDDISECFDYEDLIGTAECGGNTIYSKKRKKMVLIEDILNQTDSSLFQAREKLILDICDACMQMQDDKHYWDVREDVRNTYLRNALSNKSYSIRDQSFGGCSASGKQPGERDIVVLRDGQIQTICEALNIHGKSSTDICKWDEHLERLIDNYNATGLPFLFLVSYVECDKNSFNGVWNTFRDHIHETYPKNYILQDDVDHPISRVDYEYGHFIQVVKCIYDRDGFPTTVYHIFARIGR